MSEYNMSYEELKDFIDKLMHQSDSSSHLEKYQAAILAALTAKDDVTVNNEVAVKEAVELWENQLGTPSALLLGTRYIVIKDSLLQFLQIAVTSGALEAMLQFILNPENSQTVMSLSEGVNVVQGLISIFKNASKLENHDFCVYLQVIANSCRYKNFTLENMQEWFPHGDNNQCNMNPKKWTCDYLLEDGSCNMIKGNNIEAALASLVRKNVLQCQNKEPQKVYTFKW